MTLRSLITTFQIAQFNLYDIIITLDIDMVRYMTFFLFYHQLLLFFLESPYRDLELERTTKMDVLMEQLVESLDDATAKLTGLEAAMTPNRIGSDYVVNNEYD